MEAGEMNDDPISLKQLMKEHQEHPSIDTQALAVIMVGRELDALLSQHTDRLVDAIDRLTRAVESRGD